MLHITFERARAAGACRDRYRLFAKALGGIKRYGASTPIPLDKVLEVCGLEDAIWALQCVVEPADRQIRLFACDCAERVLPLYEKEYTDDKTPRQAIETARRYADGKATTEELEVAWSAVWSAVCAKSAVWSAAWSAVKSAAWGASSAARYACFDSSERQWQKQRFLEMLREP